MRRLSRIEREAGRNRRVPDLIRRDIRLLLVGINPSLSSGATGYHFATPGNRLWPALFGAELTSRQLDPSDTGELLSAGIGITNLVNRATQFADEVSDDELVAGARLLRSTVQTHEPRVVVVLGLGAFRTAFGAPGAQVGRQSTTLGRAQLWLLPNPSPRNPYYTVARLVSLFEPITNVLKNWDDAD
jgi:double-stranded uracil-DNA glycosylase